MPVLERPDVSDEVIAGYARAGWGLTATGVRFLPVGYDPWASAWEVSADTGERVFLKVRRRAADVAGARVARWLRDGGLTQVVAPLRTVDGGLWHADGEHVVLVYPLVDGENLWGRDLTDEQWVQLGAFLAALHGMVLPAELAGQVPAETFQCPSAARVRVMPGEFEADPVGARRELVDFWHGHAEQISALADRTDELGRLAAAQRLPAVLCHADFHAGNVLADREGRLFVVDWDGPLLAPRERDLMFVVGASFDERPVTAHQEALFLRGYGPVEPNWPALAYYRCQRALDDIAEFAQTIMFRPELSERSRLDDLRWFRGQFGPAGPVELAMADEPVLDTAGPSVN